MPLAVIRFSDEQLRVAANLAQHYDTWIGAQRASGALPYGMQWKTSSGRRYLYEISDRHGNGKSLGPASTGNEQKLEDYRAHKAELAAAIAGSRAKIEEDSRLWRALRLPRLASPAAAILREADRREILGDLVMVVGTSAMPAYSLEAGGAIQEAPDTTDDFDMAWIAESEPDADRPIWDTLKTVDPTYTINTERPFQARNRDAYEVEILVAPSRASAVTRKDQPKPFPLPEQEWLLKGNPVNHVVVALDGSPARVFAPDPRWFALHKLWMSVQEKRNALKRPKDARQGIALLGAIDEAMPHYPMEDGFEAELPSELAPLYHAWRAEHPRPDTSVW